MKTYTIYNHLQRMNKKIAVSLLFICLSIGYSWSQQLPVYTQYTMNKFIFNPAVAGCDGYTNVNLIAREQWVGFKGTPKTHAIMVNSRILGESYIFRKLVVRKEKPEKTRKGNTGWGAYLFNDLNGPIDRTGVNGTYSFHIDLGESQLSFGLSLLFSQLKIQGDQFRPIDDNDPLLTGGKQTVWTTDVNFGAYYTATNYYIGYSTLQLFNSVAQFGEKGDGDYQIERQHVLIGGYRFSPMEQIEFEPSAMIKIPETLQAQVDLSMKCIYNKKYWGGINYRTANSVSLFGGLNYIRYFFGYAFDYNFNKLGYESFGSHEFTVSMRLGATARRYKWLNEY